MNEKKRIAVFKKDASLKYGETGDLIDIIYRKPWIEQFGNFNPMFCRYKKEHHLVQSRAGDISDPFRAEEHYLNSLYIEV